MADCFSLQNAAELVEILRQCADDKNCNCKECKFVITENNLCMNIMINCAADAIEQLVTKCSQLEAENAKLKAERDALIKEIGYVDCDNCKYDNTANEKCSVCDWYYSEWEWKGAKCLTE